MQLGKGDARRKREQSRAERRTTASVPAAEQVLKDMIVLERFVDAGTCDRLVGLHRRLGSLTNGSDNGLDITLARKANPKAFTTAKQIIDRLRELIRSHYDASVYCDLTLVCALTAGGFRHTLHADNARVACPRHGDDAEQLVSVQCSCPDVVVVPNHTPWRDYSALLYLSDGHAGGDIVFGAGPNAYGRIFRKELHPTRGLLAVFPSNELYFHHTTTVTTGVRYSMNSWFTTDPAHASAGWR